MSEILQSTSDIPFEDSIPEAGATLESILCTEELRRRPSRPPDYEKENRALVALMERISRFAEHHLSDTGRNDPGYHAV